MIEVIVSDMGCWHMGFSYMGFKQVKILTFIFLYAKFIIRMRYGILFLNTKKVIGDYQN